MTLPRRSSFALPTLLEFVRSLKVSHHLGSSQVIGQVNDRSQSETMEGRS